MELLSSVATERRPDSSLFANGLVIARHFLHECRLHFPLAVLIILFSGLLEGIGILALLPALDIVIDSAGNESEITRYFRETFAFFGLSLTLISIVSVMVVLVTIKSLLMFLGNLYVAYITTGLDKHYRLRLIRALLRVQWPYFVGEPIGRITNSIYTEAHQTANAANALMLIASSAIQACVYLAAALLVSWKLTVAGIVAGIVVTYLLKIFIQITREQGQIVTDLNRTYHSRLIDWMHSVKPLKAMGVEERVSSYIERETHDIMVTDRRLARASQALINLQEPITTFFIAVGVVVAIQNFEISTSALLVMVALFARSVGRISGLQQAAKKLARLEAAFFAYMAKVKSIEAARELEGGARDEHAPQTPITLRSAITVKELCFAYDDRQILQNLNATLAAGQITVILGHSGSGKSTFLDLLTGLLEPTSGQILIDDVNLRSIRKHDWRMRLGYVPQDSTLLHATIAENLTLGDESISDADVEAALRKAGAWDFVMEMPESIHSIVGERGLKISGGQRQRLAIARALLRKPHLLLLDEATSALDSETERAFCQILTRLTPEVTIVAVSHRPALCEIADKAYRIEGERFVETKLGDSAVAG